MYLIWSHLLSRPQGSHLADHQSPAGLLPAPPGPPLTAMQVVYCQRRAKGAQVASPGSTVLGMAPPGAAFCKVRGDFSSPDHLFSVHMPTHSRKGCSCPGPTFFPISYKSIRDHVHPQEILTCALGNPHVRNLSRGGANLQVSQLWEPWPWKITEHLSPPGAKNLPTPSTVGPAEDQPPC